MTIDEKLKLYTQKEEALVKNALSFVNELIKEEAMKEELTSDEFKTIKEIVETLSKLESYSVHKIEELEQEIKAEVKDPIKRTPPELIIEAKSDLLKVFNSTKELFLKLEKLTEKASDEVLLTSKEGFLLINERLKSVKKDLEKLEKFN